MPFQLKLPVRIWLILRHPTVSLIQWVLDTGKPLEKVLLVNLEKSVKNSKIDFIESNLIEKQHFVCLLEYDHLWHGFGRFHRTIFKRGFSNPTILYYLVVSLLFIKYDFMNQKILSIFVKAPEPTAHKKFDNLRNAKEKT